MSIFEDQASRTMSLSEVDSALANLDLNSAQRAYAEGYFACINDWEGIRGRNIEWALDNMRDSTKDYLSSSQVQRLREELEKLWAE